MPGLLPGVPVGAPPVVSLLGIAPLFGVTVVPLPEVDGPAPAVPDVPLEVSGVPLVLGVPAVPDMPLELEPGDVPPAPEVPLSGALLVPDDPLVPELSLPVGLELVAASPLVLDDPLVVAASVLAALFAFRFLEAFFLGSPVTDCASVLDPLASCADCRERMSWACCSTAAAFAGSVLSVTPCVLCANVKPVTEDKDSKIAAEIFFIVSSKKKND